MSGTVKNFLAGTALTVAAVGSAFGQATNCRDLANEKQPEAFPSAGLAFAQNANIGCKYQRAAGGEYVVTGQFDLNNPREAQRFSREYDMAARRDDAQARREQNQAERDARRNSPLRQGQETVRDLRQYKQLGKQLENIFGR